MLLVGISIFLLEQGHVVSNVPAKDVLAVDLSIQRLGLSVVASKAARAVGDGQATINGTLEDTKDAVAGGGAGQTSVQKAEEGLGIASGLDVVLGTIGLLLALVGVGKLELGQEAASNKQASAYKNKIR